MNVRMLPPINPIQQTRVVNGRTYTGAPGNFFDVPDFDGEILQANGWTYVAPSGPTSSRPTVAPGLHQAIPGSKYFDTTLSLMIVFDGSTWRDPATGNAV